MPDVSKISLSRVQIASKYLRQQQKQHSPHLNVFTCAPETILMNEDRIYLIKAVIFLN